MESANETRTLAPPGGTSSKKRQDPATLTRGAAVGRYVVLRCLGAGGMGVVYAAWDSELDRRVALKLLRPDLAGSDSKQVHERLLREAQALARLSHPNVVAVHDAGTFDGRVFLVMEFVEGLSFAEWLEEEPAQESTRSWRQVAARFREAALGLAAVHEAGLVHRDVKPSNLMLGADGRVRVVDFGLAQPMAQEAVSTESVTESVSTEMGLRLVFRGPGTPAFMAPEQHHGEPADARCDQFGFCVSLFHALYGELPFGSGSTSETLPRAERGEVVEPRGSRVPGWLRGAVLRGLNFDPKARYPSMVELAEALAGDPAVRRRRWAAALAAFVLLAVALAFFFRYQAQAAWVCRGAERKLEGVWDPQRQQALRGAFLAVDQPYAASAWLHVNQSLERYVEGWLEMHVEACEATRLHREQSESLMDLRMACLGDRVEEARALTDVLTTADQDVVARSASMLSTLSSLRPCADIAALTAVTPPPGDETLRSRVDEIRGRVARAKTRTELGQASASLPLLAVAAEEAKEVGYAPLEAQALLRFAEAHGRLGHFEVMEEILYEALRAALEGRAERTASMVRLNLVIVGWFSGRFAEAERWAKLAGGSIGALGDAELEAMLLHRRGMLDNRQGRFEQALEHFRAALELKKTLYPPGDPRIVGSLNNMGIAYRRLGRYKEALESYRADLAILENSYGRDHPDTAALLGNMGMAYRYLGEPRQALPPLEKSLEILEKLGESVRHETATPLEALGEVYLDLEEPAKAIEVLERSLALRIEVGVDPIDVASVRFNLARALVAASNTVGLNTDGPSTVERARRLAHQARGTYAELGPRAERQFGEVESWLAEHGWSI